MIGLRFGLRLAALGISCFGIVAAAPAAAPAAATPAATTAAEPGGALPLDIAYSRREIQRYQGRGQVSHDGKWLAYGVFTPPMKSPGADLEAEPRILPNGTPAHVVGMSLIVADTATGKERPVCAAKQNCWRPSWSPDDRRVAYFSDAGGVAQVYVYDLATSQGRRVAETRIKAKLWPGDEAAWSPDGKEIFVPVELHAPEPEPGQAVKGPKDPNKPTVTVYRTAAEAPPAAAAAPGATPEAMLKHFIRENNATLAAIDVASGKMRVVVPAETEPRPSCMRISPDGKWISYLSIFKTKGETASESYYDIAVAPAAGGPVRVVAPDVQVNEDGEYFESTYRWIPGSRIVYLKDKKLWVADVDGASREPRPLAADLGPLTNEPLLLTRDGRGILVGLEAEGKKTYYHVPPRALALVPFDGGAAKTFSFSGGALSADEGTLWQPDPGHFFVLLRDAKTAERSIARVDVATGQTQPLWKGLGRFEGAGAGTGGGHSWIARYESTDTSGDYYRFDDRFAGRFRISHAEPRLDGIRIGPMQAFVTTVPAYDGKLVNVTTAAFLPAARKPGERLPTLVYFYGGSQVLDNAQEYGGGATNSIPAAIFTTRGYAVLLVDVPLGPEGSGGNPIQEMAEVILPQVHHAIELGIADPNRIAIMGQSYGGYGTASMITQTNLFRAAIALDGLYDLPGTFATMGAGGSTFNFVWSETGQGRMGTHPWADLRRYLANSPYYQADKIHTPLLLIHGKIDKTCPVEGAERMYNALKRLERPAELAIYDGEGHVPGTWSFVNAVDATNRMLEFLSKHLSASREEKR
ncbi:MAG: prolyl oligopeptidase family serine peptidase [Acidobacteriota bacterium]